MNDRRPLSAVLTVVLSAVTLAAVLVTGTLTPSARAATAFEQFGGLKGIEAMTTDFVDRVHANPRLAAFFVDSSKRRLIRQLSDQFCFELGGGCVYKGGDMKSVHARMEITTEHFNALVEDLQISMDKFKIPFGAQNVLLAKLAPMNRDIISDPSKKK